MSTLFQNVLISWRQLAAVICDPGCSETLQILWCGDCSAAVLHHDAAAAAAAGAGRAAGALQRGARPRPQPRPQPRPRAAGAGPPRGQVAGGPAPPQPWGTLSNGTCRQISQLYHRFTITLQSIETVKTRLIQYTLSVGQLALSGPSVATIASNVDKDT